jgi:hypothetical protein
MITLSVIALIKRIIASEIEMRSVISNNKTSNLAAFLFSPCTAVIVGRYSTTSWLHSRASITAGALFFLLTILRPAVNFQTHISLNLESALSRKHGRFQNNSDDKVNAKKFQQPKIHTIYFIYQRRVSQQIPIGTLFSRSIIYLRPINLRFVQCRKSNFPLFEIF